MDKTKNKWEEWGTVLTHAARPKPSEAGVYVNPSIGRGSTVLFNSYESMCRTGEKRYEDANIYGAMSSPLQHELEGLVASIEGGKYCQAVGSGLAACILPLLAFLKAGDHCLFSDSVYGPTRRFAREMLQKFGVEISFFPPLCDEEQLRTYVRDNTKMIFAESPGSHSFEVQDIPMIARVARQHDALLLMDNTWGFGIFNPFEHGVDVSIQALTKYAAGHSDLVAGAVTVAKESLWKLLRDSAIQMGQVLDPQACWLTLRGLRTLGVRLSYQEKSAYEIACWLNKRPEISEILHPALKNCPGHQFWKRDFTGAGSLFGVRFKENISHGQMIAMIDHLKLFGIGASWGGFESLVLPSDNLPRNHGAKDDKRCGLRLQIGLEKTADLIADLTQGLEKLARA